MQSLRITPNLAFPFPELWVLVGEIHAIAYCGCQLVLGASVVIGDPRYYFGRVWSFGSGTYLLFPEGMLSNSPHQQNQYLHQLLPQQGCPQPQHLPYKSLQLEPRSQPRPHMLLFCHGLLCMCEVQEFGLQEKYLYT
jgi:hypothetical protein